MPPIITPAEVESVIALAKDAAKAEQAVAGAKLVTEALSRIHQFTHTRLSDAECFGSLLL